MCGGGYLGVFGGGRMGCSGSPALRADQDQGIFQQYSIQLLHPAVLHLQVLVCILSSDYGFVNIMWVCPE